MDLVSIITPAYNSGRFIGDTIESVIGQSYTDWELLITDDCSTDDTVTVVREYCRRDERVKLFVLDKNSGAGVARNNSIAQARGRFIAFLDSDDRWLPDKLEKQVNFMRETGCACSYSSYLVCGEDDASRGMVICREKETKYSILKDDRIGCLTMMYDTLRMGKIYLPCIRRRQDWGLKILVLNKCDYALGIREPLAIYRERSNSLSRNKWRLIKYNIAIYRVTLGWSQIKSVCYFALVFLPHHFAKVLRTTIEKRLLVSLNKRTDGFLLRVP